MSAASTLAPRPAVPTRRSVHVLVVEDSPDHQVLIERALDRAGYLVAVAPTGELALSMLAGVDVVLIDQRLPGMSGAQLLESVVAMPDGPAPVVVTGAGSQDLVVEALRLGAVDYVVKSSDYLAELPAVVARAHQQRDLGRRYRELQRFALMVHEPMARDRVVHEIVTAAHRLLAASGVALARRERRGSWAIVAMAGTVDDVDGLLAWLAARDRVTVTPRPGEVVVDLPADADERPGSLVLVTGSDAPFEAEEVQLAATFAAFASSALRQIRRLELEQGLVDQLQRSVRARQDFVASVSHELRTPLTVITGYTETLLQRGDAIPDGLRERLLGRVLGNAGALRRLIDQLLDVASLERGGRLTPRTQAVDLRQVVEQVVEELAFELGERPGRRQLSSVPVLGDPDLVRRTVANLVSNACKYSQAGTRVDIDAVDEGAYVRLRVHDRGVGVDPQDRARVFEPFWRGTTAVAEAIRGTGIGLALVREYVSAMGGEVGVDALDGGGSTFWFTIPRAEPHSSDGPRPDAEAAPPGTTMGDADRA